MITEYDMCRESDRMQRPKNHRNRRNLFRWTGVNRMWKKQMEITEKEAEGSEAGTDDNMTEKR